MKHLKKISAYTFWPIRSLEWKIVQIQFNNTPHSASFKFDKLGSHDCSGPYCLAEFSSQMSTPPLPHNGHFWEKFVK